MDRKLSTLEGYNELTESAFYVMSEGKIGTQVGLKDGSLEVHALSFLLLNEAKDDAVISVVAAGDATFHTDDFVVKGFGGLVTNDDKRSGTGTLTFKTNAF